MARQREDDDFYFDGFENPTTTPVPDVVFDRFLSKLGEAELKALLYIIRRTFGFKKDHDPISFNQFLRGIVTRDGRVLDEGCGIRNRTTLSTALKSLERMGIVKAGKGKDERGENETTVYSLRFRHDPEANSGPGVVRNSYHRSTEPAPPVVRPAYPQQTALQDTAQQHDVVVTHDALAKFGISETVARKLAATYPEPYVLAKLDLVQWLVETRSPLVGKNPAGYLRRAIEEDYAAPPKYKSPAQRQAEAEAHDQAEQNEQERRRVAEADYARAKVLDQQQLAEHYPPQPIPGTTLTTQQAWEQTLDQLHTQVTRPNFEMWLRPTTLVSCDGQRAVIAAPSRYHTETLAGRLTPLVQHALSTVLSTPVQCQYVPMSDLLEVGEHSENGRTPRNFRSPTGKGHPQAASP